MTRAKPTMPEIIRDLDPSGRAVLNVMMDHIVNPRCDECEAALHDLPLSERPHGPHLCDRCKLAGRIDFERRLAEFRAAEGKRRSVHIVKLPEGMCKP